MRASEEEGYTLRASRRSVYGVILALVSLVSAVVVAYVDNRPNISIDAPDRYTGKQGEAHELRTTAVEQQLVGVQEWIVAIGLQLQRIESNAAQCREHYEELREDVDRHDEYSDGKVEQITQFQATMIERVNTLHEITRECMSRTRPQHNNGDYR